jgi:hypothetical protein
MDAIQGGLHVAGTLIFPVNEKLLRIIAHSKAHPCEKAYSHEAAGPGLFLVKDSGVYLMSAATEPLRKEGGEGSVVAYAEGHDPAQGECWEYDREVCGGDDFGEFIPIAALEEHQHPLDEDCGRLGLAVRIRLTDRSMLIKLMRYKAPVRA